MIFSLKMVVSPFQGKLLMEEIHTSHSTNWLACLEISGPREWKEDGLNTKVTFCLFTVEDYIVDGLSIEIWTQFGFSHYSQWPHSYENYIESQLGWFMKTNQDRLDFGYFPDRQKHRSLRYWLLPSQNNLRGGVVCLWHQLPVLTGIGGSRVAEDVGRAETQGPPASNRRTNTRWPPIRTT